MRHGRWFEPLAGERFDLIVANPPYVAAGDPHLADLGFEPRGALVAGADGLDAIREIARERPRHLRPAAGCSSSTAWDRTPRCARCWRRRALKKCDSWPDLARNTPGRGRKG